MTVIDEWGDMWKGTEVVYFKVLAHVCPKYLRKYRKTCWDSRFPT
jgi:hypothetical protein